MSPQVSEKAGERGEPREASDAGGLGDGAFDAASPSRATAWLPRPASPAERLLHVVVVLFVLGVYAALIGLESDARGHGTHEQLGMAPCAWPMRYGIPCPTCGVTTSATHLLQLRPLTAFATQPFGALLTLLGLVYVVTAVRYVWRGESLVARVADWPLGRLSLGAVALLLLSWWWVAERFSA